MNINDEGIATFENIQLMNISTLIIPDHRLKRIKRIKNLINAT